jgi:hypothetical protein
VPEQPIVCDTTVLLYLGRIGQSELLPAQYRPALVPEAVTLELEMCSDWLMNKHPRCPVRAHVGARGMSLTAVAQRREAGVDSHPTRCHCEGRASLPGSDRARIEGYASK